MDSNMSTAAFMHRSGGSSSSSSAGTGSSNGAGPGNPVGGSRMAVIGVTRNIILRRRGASSFGFSLRGGREYAAGFFISNVEPGGEAHRNGLRVGDQILRVNGYPVEDAVHQEVALLVKNQQVLVLKIQSVGMIPVKDNPNDPVTWHMVQQQQQQLQYNENGGVGAVSNTEVRIRIRVGEKGQLGCGVCRGIVPGLTVQGTREGGPARAAGLKAGDVIIWCNGQRLTDLPFERAIEVMRGSAVLDLIVQRPPPNHLYDCPEPLWTRVSSGYDSETSSIVATSPLPLQNPSSSPQHLRDPRIQQGRYPRDDTCNRNGRICCPLALSTSSCTSSSEWSHVDQAQDWIRKANNTTVIRVNQNQGLLMQNQNHRHQHPHHHQQVRLPPSSIGHRRLNSRGNYEDDDMDNEPLYDPVAPRIDYEVHDFDANPRDEANRRLAYRRDNNIRQQDVIYDGPPDDLPIYHSTKENGQHDVNRLGEMQLVQRQTETDRKTMTSVVEVQSVCPPAPPPPLPYKWPADAKPMNAMGMQMGSTMSMGSTGSTETESSLESSCSKDSASTSSSLSTSSCEPPSSTISFGSTTVPSTGSNKTNESSSMVVNRGSSNLRTSPIASTDLSTAITQELQRRAQQRSLNAAKAEATKEKSMVPPKPTNPEALRAQEQKVTHDKLMEEFKRAHRKMFNAAQQRVQFSDQVTEPEQEKNRVPLANGSTTTTTASSNLTNTTNENKTTIPNATTSSNNFNNINNNNNNNNNNATSSIIPPPPPAAAAAIPAPVVPAPVVPAPVVPAPVVPAPVVPAAPPAPPLPLPTKIAGNSSNNQEDSVEMQSIESFKLKESPNPAIIPKPPPTYFPLSNSSSATTNGSPRHVHVPIGNKSTTTTQVIKEKDHQHQQSTTSPPNETNKNSNTTVAITNTTTNTNTNTNSNNAISPNGNSGGGVPKATVGKVAIRIGAYEGEAKQPAKLDFLAQQPRTEKNGTEEANGPVVSRLQNELAATLQRSNLRRKTEGENQTTTAKSISDNTSTTTTSEKDTTNNLEPNKLPQSTVEKLATALGNKVTIRVNPDDSGNR